MLVDFQTDELIKSGRLVAETRTDVMKTGIGVAVKRGAPRPDIGTVDAFTRTLLDARSITYLKEGASTIYLDRLFARLGIAEALRAKTVKPDTESVSERVAQGEVELGMFNISEVLLVKGVTLAGALPPELQSYIVFAAAIHAGSTSVAAAGDYIKLLSAPAARERWRAGGLESMAPGS
jgi:molybdate transport system substrate-binding protein